MVCYLFRLFACLYVCLYIYCQRLQDKKLSYKPVVSLLFGHALEVLDEMNSAGAVERLHSVWNIAMGNIELTAFTA